MKSTKQRRTELKAERRTKTIKRVKKLKTEINETRVGFLADAILAGAARAPQEL